MLWMLGVAGKAISIRRKPKKPTTRRTKTISRIERGAFGNDFGVSMMPRSANSRHFKGTHANYRLSTEGTTDNCCLRRIFSYLTNSTALLAFFSNVCRTTSNTVRFWGRIISQFTAIPGWRRINLPFTSKNGRFN